MVLTQPWLPLPAATALALAAQLATTISVALVTSSTGFLLTWSGLLFIATAYWFVHRSATLAASPAASAVFLRLPLALCAATLWLLFLTGLSAVLPEPGSRALLMPAAGALVRSALGVEADSADEVQLRWTSGMFALGGLGALLALQALWTLLDEHRSALTGDALRSGHLGADGHRVTVVDVLLAGAAGAQPVTMPPPPVAPNAPRGGVDVEKGAAGARNGLPSRAHTHTVGRALLAPALRALLGEALLLGSQVLLLRPVAAGALFARTGGPAMGADDEGVMAGQPMGDAGNDLASLQAVASAFQGSGCAQLHAAAAARVASAALLALSLAAAVAVASGLGRYRDFWAAAASAPFPRASAQPTAAAPLFAVATPAAAASHLWWLLGALPHAALLVLLQFAAGTWLLALLQVHARADASDGRIDLAQLLEAGLASTQVGRALVSAAVCAAVFCALCLHCYRAHALRMLPLADLGAVDTGAADGGSPGLGKSSPGRSR
ncbi:hypothetical protein T492DRAFT_840684 [Pavlovales sp. CCMP2436]|nr:hypothetical protein T492DRAFT_840684 [Pavlovales sp. CCMP2436]